MTGPQIARLSVEHDARSVAATAAPRLSWQTVTETPGWLQSQYELRIASSDGDSYSTDWVESGESVLVPWPAPALTSREERTVEVRVRGVDGSMSEWSDPVPVDCRTASRRGLARDVRRAGMGRGSRVAAAVSVPPARRSRSRSR